MSSRSIVVVAPELPSSSDVTNVMTRDVLAPETTDIEGADDDETASGLKQLVCFSKQGDDRDAIGMGELSGDGSCGMMAMTGGWRMRSECDGIGFYEEPERRFWMVANSVIEKNRGGTEAKNVPTRLNIRNSDMRNSKDLLNQNNMITRSVIHKRTPIFVYHRTKDQIQSAVQALEHVHV